jgi:hypothetical protein
VGLGRRLFKQSRQEVIQLEPDQRQRRMKMREKTGEKISGASIKEDLITSSRSSPA